VTLQTASSDDLFALADAARYRRRADLARSALLAQRRRFPSSPRSLDAIFLLGRVEELRAGGRAPAIEWYDEYRRPWMQTDARLTRDAPTASKSSSAPSRADGRDPAIRAFRGPCSNATHSEEKRKDASLVRIT
jgi:hypothetical protein